MTLSNQCTQSKCGVKISTKPTGYLSQECGVRQGCCLSPTLFNIYINELASSLERSTAPGLTLHNSQIRCLLYADDLVLLSPTQHGLQQNLDLLQQYCQTCMGLDSQPEENQHYDLSEKIQIPGNTTHIYIRD